MKKKWKMRTEGEKRLRLAGLRKTSVIDFPDRIAAVVFTRGCNFYCPYCHNSQLINSRETAVKGEDIPEALFFSFLEKRSALLDGLTITGGEPLLQPDLRDFIKRVKQEFGLEIKLDTNGSLPAELSELLDAGLVDYTAVDVKMSWDNYELMAAQKLIPRIKKTIELLIDSDIEYEFRTTAVPGIHNKAEIRKIAASIEGAEKYYLQNFKAVNTLDPVLEKRRSFTPAELDIFKETAEKKLELVEIRN